ncbi:MAG: D-aminoacylase [Cyclobacteriaceae bacterium]
MRKFTGYLTCLVLIVFIGCQEPPKFDILIKNATIYDGTGNPPTTGIIGINADTIAAIGSIEASGTTEVDAAGMAVSPGFVNMLSWSTQSLLIDGRSMGEIKQGVTLEVMGEGFSMGPINESMKQEIIDDQDPDASFDVDWTSLGEYLQSLENRGVSTNVASFVGATSLRVHEIGYEDRPPTDEELDRMRELAKQAMEEGAMGIGSSLIYAPAFYASTEELIELCKAAAEYNGMYITHMRSEGNRLLEAVDETIQIASEAGLPAEIYHLKAAGKKNWHKMDSVIEKIENARDEGIRITTDMYNYTAGSTGLDAAMPPWAQEGGYEMWKSRLEDPVTRAKIKEEMQLDAQDWENLHVAAGSSENVLLVGFKNDSLRELYQGKNLAEAAEIHGKDAFDTAMDLVIHDGTRVQVVYFLMSEENVKKQIALPYMSFDSDAASMAAEGVFLKRSTHPRAYGNFARLLGKYVREEKVISLEEAIRKLTSLPVSNLGIKKRGLLKEGYFADIVIFDPNSIKDNATYEEPHQYASGVMHVFVNGSQVLKNGEHTGAKPGRFVKGPGFKK